ncbi:hypothetical protein F0P96_19455 [Hymenobacter busanensis]|uniref:Uncharacterized protein n=1 Tax=Hymenobacter busanensis TaxID=2607656 RepID=A0A7L4ZXP7_9BACT|nr:hypothetical protein [Hymenobacter busanensis]KAA9325512.1 hypothetical protein F0P96_19455 [Hymenobacter busanensis]QHJ07817.1 hypothetical protein GUY19_11210 [Hymenobacter busanensis]
MSEEPDFNRLDESLREAFSDYTLPPAAPVWRGIEERLAALPPEPRPARRPLPLPWLLPLAVLLGVAIGWLLPKRVVVPPNSTVVARTLSQSATPATLAPAALARRQPAAHVSASGYSSLQHSTSDSRLVRLPAVRPAVGRTAVAPQLASAGAISPQASVLTTVVVASVDSIRTSSSETAAAARPQVSAGLAFGLAAPDSVPGALRELVALERATQWQRRDSAAPQLAVLRSALRAKRAELIRLRLQTDSLLLALGEAPGTEAPAVAATPAPAPDTAQPHRPPHRWSLLLTGAAEQNYLRLNTSDTLLALRRNHEMGRKGINVAAMAECRLTDRLSVGAGLGYNTLGTEMRLTNRRTDVTVTYDTTITHTSQYFTSTHTVYSVRDRLVPQLSPVFNQSGQVLRYDTVYVAIPDTVFTTILQHDSIRTTQKTVTPLVSKRETTTYKTLTPNYRFVTLPLLLRYRLTPATGSRWWADVAAGAQVQLFLGGTQLVTEDGRSYRTERIRVHEGPFRPLNLVLSGSLALNYGLTSRLSVSVAPALRWQALSVYRPAAGVRQQSTATGLQFGVRWAL